MESKTGAYRVVCHVHPFYTNKISQGLALWHWQISFGSWHALTAAGLLKKPEMLNGCVAGVWSVAAAMQFKMFLTRVFM